MKKHLLQAISGIALILMLSVSGAFAQSSEVLIANIPFSFHIGQLILPAGEYVVKPVSTTANKYIKIRSVDSAHIMMLLTVPVGTKSGDQDAKLVFNQYGSHYFLSKIVSPLDGINEMLFRGRLEKEFAANTGKQASSIEVALGRR